MLRTRASISLIMHSPEQNLQQIMLLDNAGGYKCREGLGKRYINVDDWLPNSPQAYNYISSYKSRGHSAHSASNRGRNQPCLEGQSSSKNHRSQQSPKYLKKGSPWHQRRAQSQEFQSSKRHTLIEGYQKGFTSLAHKYSERSAHSSRESKPSMLKTDHSGPQAVIESVNYPILKRNHKTNQLDRKSALNVSKVRRLLLARFQQKK